MKKNDEVFQNPFVKEYLFNLQNNQKISINEFLFTKKVAILCTASSFLLWYNNDSTSSQKYIFVATIMIFLYMFRNNRILKKEKYKIKKDDNIKSETELIFHSQFNKIVKNILKKNYLIFFILFGFYNNSYAKFVTEIDTSISTQQNSNSLYSNENTEMINRAKIKTIMYLNEEKKYFTSNEINSHINIESDLYLNIIKTQIEKAKNEIKQ